MMANSVFITDVSSRWAEMTGAAKNLNRREPSSRSSTSSSKKQRSLPEARAIRGGPG